MSTPKMYILVRKDLAETYRCVQGAHALAQFDIEFPDKFKLWANSCVVFLGVSNLNELKFWHEKLKNKHIEHSIFKEPDLDHQMTALSCYGDGTIFKDLKLA